MAEKMAAGAKTIAYDVINSYFTKHIDTVLEVEVLPSALAPTDGQLVLEDGTFIGIPKRVLAGAFVEAVQRFFKLKDIGDAMNEEERVEAIEATNIILLFDPEHLTAANYRKTNLTRLINEAKADTENKILRDAFVCAVRQEFCFLNTILTSPLHRQTKSPTLWSHRRWLFALSLEEEELIEEATGKSFLFKSAAKSELLIVMKAGERHPMNYYAWQYARHLIDIIERNCSYLLTYDREAFLDKVVPPVLDWCLRHPGDTSGFSFLQTLISDPDCLPRLARKAVTETLKLAKNFRWYHESIKSFLKSAMMIESVLDKQIEKEYLLYLDDAKNSSTVATIAEKRSEELVHQSIGKRKRESMSPTMEDN